MDYKNKETGPAKELKVLSCGNQEKGYSAVDSKVLKAIC